MIRFSFKIIFLVGIMFFLLFSFLPKNLNEYFVQPLMAEIAVDEDFQVGVVLGAGLEIGGLVSDLGKERVEFAVKVFEDTNVPLLFTGGKSEHGIESVAMNEYARDLGYDGETLLEDRSTSTYENAKYSDQILDDKDVEVESVLVLTSAFHSRRSLATFKKVMPEREIFIAYPNEQAVLNDSIRGRWKGLYRIIREYVAIGFYKMRFGI